MKNAKQIYSRLLKLYPPRYRKAFGAQMMQTFLDHYEDVAAANDRVRLDFWLSMIADEIQNITEQQRACLLEENEFFRVTSSKLIASAVLLVPLYAVFLAAFAKAVLALPHPHVSGLGVVAALAALALVPGIFSLTASYVFASAIVRVFLKRQVRTA